MKQHKFDIVMDYIDRNVKNDYQEILKGIYDEIYVNSRIFGEVFTVLTGGDTLKHYVTMRRLYLAARELLERPDKPICDIASEYKFSDQSAFTNAFRTKYGVPPKKFRTSYYIEVPNDKYYFEDFSPNPSDNYSDIMWREFERNGAGCINLQYLDEVERWKGYFDIDTRYAIADLAMRLDIPISRLMEECFQLVAEINSDPDNLSDKALSMLHLGIKSVEELEEICKYYKCKYYELDAYMVMEYHGIPIYREEEV